MMKQGETSGSVTNILKCLEGVGVGEPNLGIFDQIWDDIATEVSSHEIIASVYVYIYTYIYKYK